MPAADLVERLKRSVHCFTHESKVLASSKLSSGKLLSQLRAELGGFRKEHLKRAATYFACEN